MEAAVAEAVREARGDPRAVDRSAIVAQFAGRVPRSTAFRWIAWALDAHAAARRAAAPGALGALAKVSVTVFKVLKEEDPALARRVAAELAQLAGQRGAGAP